MQPLPRAPKSLTKESKKLWNEIVSQFAIDDAPGLAILETALLAKDRAEQLRTAINAAALMFKDARGQPKAHPLLCEERGARSAFLAGMKALQLEIPTKKAKKGRPLGS